MKAHQRALPRRLRFSRAILSPLALRVLGAAAALGAHVILARLTGPGVVGLYALGFVLVWLLAMAGRLGLDHVLVRHTATASEHHGRAGVLRLHGRVAALALGGSAAAAAALYLSAGPLGTAFGMPRLPSYIEVMALGLVPLSGVLLAAEAFRGLGRGGAYVFFATVSLQALLIAFFAGLVEPGTDRMVPVAYASAATVSLALAALAYWRAIATLPAVSGRPGATAGTGALLNEGRPLLANGLMEFTLQMAGVVVLGFVATESEVGIFRIALRTAMVLGFVAFAVNAVISQQLARSSAAGDNDTVVRLCRRMSGFAVLAGLPGILVLLAAPEPVLSLFGRDFAPGSPALQIIGGAYLFALAGAPATTALVMAGHGRAQRNAMAWAAGINLALNLALVPLYGVTGSAIAFAVSLVVLAGGVSLAARRHFGAFLLPLPTRRAGAAPRAGS